MADLGALQALGAQPTKPTKYFPISTQKFFSGLWSQRSPFNNPDNRYNARFLGGRPDILIDGSNVELTNYGTYIRRYGLSPYTNQTVTPPILSFYTHRHPTNPLENHVIVDTATTVYHVDPTSKSTLLTKAPGAGQCYFQEVGSTLYMGDGIDLQAWDITNPVRNWGIVISPTGNATGPNACGTGADIAGTGQGPWSNPGNITANDGAFASVTVLPIGNSIASGPNYGTGSTPGGGQQPWTNVNGIHADDGTFATCGMGPSGGGFDFSNALYATNLGFAIPGTGTILGIVVEINRERFAGLGSIEDNNVGLLKAGTPVGSNLAAVGNWPNALTRQSYGSSSNLWGTTWTPADINNPSFGAFLEVDNTDAAHSVTAGVDSIRVTITYANPAASASSDLLEGTNFGFALPAGNTVTGILVEVKGVQTANPANTFITVQMLKSGLQVGQPKTNLQLPGVNGFISLGANNDLWGTTWAPNDVNQTSFGISIVGTNNNGVSNATWNVDFVRITVYGIGGPSPTVSGAAGSLTTTNGGWEYCYAYGNSASGHVSNATPAGPPTGNFAAKASVSINVVASPDPQVNQIWVFRTKDGGSVFYNLPTSPYPNTNATITDTNPDSGLVLTQIAPLAPLNNPPPAGLGKMTYHLGRMWGVDGPGNTVYYSGGPDTLLGNGNEAWPPANFFTFPTAVNRLVPITSGLLVFTVDGVYIIVGTSTATFYAVPFMPGTGLVSYNALDLQGSNIFLYTADRQFVSLNSVGVTELGFAIGDQLQANYNPATVYIASHVAGTQDKAVFIADGSAHWFRCNWNQPPEGGPAWSPQATLTFGATAIASIETSPGVYQLLVGQSNGQIMARNLSVFADNGTAFSAYLTLGSLVLAQPGQLAEVQSITTELQNVGSVPSVSVLLEEIGGTFEALPTSVNDPPTLSAPATLISKRFYLTQGQNPVVCRHLQIKVTFATEAAKNELLTLSVFGALELKE